MSNCGGNCGPSCSPEGLNFEDLKRCEPNKTPFTRRKILIICTGNSCRSQMAQGWLRFFDERLDVYSAGTRPEKKVNPNAVKVMEEVGINIKGHYTKHIDKFTKDNFDYAITVCKNKWRYSNSILIFWLSFGLKHHFIRLIVTFQIYKYSYANSVGF